MRLAWSVLARVECQLSNLLLCELPVPGCWIPRERYRVPSTNRTKVPIMRFTLAASDWSKARTYPNARATSKHECVSRIDPSAV